MSAAGDEDFELRELRRLPSSSNVFGPLNAAVIRAAENVEIAVAVPVDDKRIAVIAFNLEWGIARLHLFGHWVEFPFALAFEEIKRAKKVADNQIELAIAVPIDGKRPR